MVIFRGFSSGKALRYVSAFALCLGISTMGRAEVRLPALFSDHMVLQRDSKIPVWGWADAAEEVTVTFAGQSVKTTADAQGKWRADLGSVAANATPQTMTITGKNTIQIADVLVGDVWVCSGQSNMGVQLGEVYNAADVVPKAHDPLLRLFAVKGATSIHREDDVTTSWSENRKWVISDPDTARIFTAVGWFFGNELRSDLHIPIGLVESLYGGTRAQLWTSVGAIEKNVDADPEFRDWLEQRKQMVDAYPQKLPEYLPLKAKYDQDLANWFKEVWNTPEFAAKRAAWDEDNNKARAEGKRPLPRLQPPVPRPMPPDPPDGGPYSTFMVGNLYNAMIAPLMPYAIKGVAWYQGESNDKNSKQYGVLFPIMIQDWRANWGEGDFSFVFVQLPNINAPATEPVQNKDHWPGMREAQAIALKLPNTAMAVTIDVGDPWNVHGKDKYDVGYRLALATRHEIYGEKIVYTGPTYDSMKVKGKKIEIAFKNTGSGLVIGASPWTPTGAPPVADKLKGFAIAGEDQKWVWAQAEIKGNHVEVWSGEVPNPVAVRYGWADNPPCNLYNREKLPAAPFRTDNW